MLLAELESLANNGKIPKIERTHYINNHIHTDRSFSPYTPASAVYTAYLNGLATAGIMDHDTVDGANEFIEAGRIIGLPVTVGVECRVSMKNTPFADRRLNNPDQLGCAYVAMHGIPHASLESVDEFFAPYRCKRNMRNREMCRRITELVSPYGLSLDFDKDVLPLARASVTERHILFALTKKITALYDTPEKVVGFLKDTMKINLSQKTETNILHGMETPQFYEYDILGALKSDMVSKFYVPATDELPSLDEFIGMVKKAGGISAYAYLGDVTNSVTGDKKAQTFEDSYLEELFAFLKDAGFDAVTFMPTRNTLVQLERVMELCRKFGFFQISGEDINSPRQSFICKAYDDERFHHLIDAAYTLIEYERVAASDMKAARALICKA